MSLESLLLISEFRQPLWFLLLLIPVIHIVIGQFFSNAWLPKKYFDPAMQYWYLNHSRSDHIARKKIIIIDLLFWLFLSTAIAGPQYAVTVPEDYQTDQGETVLVLLDNSASMNATDIKPSRLIRAKNELLLFIGALYPGDRLAVMLFSASSHLLFPPTSDKQAMRFYIESIQPNMLPYEGSTITDAIKSADTFLSASESTQSSPVLLITDGDVEFPGKMIKSIKDSKLKRAIYTLGVGLKVNAPIPSSNPKFQWYEKDGMPVYTDLNEDFLQRIATLTNAKYQSVSDNNSDFDIIYKENIKARNKQSKDSHHTNWIQLYHGFLLLAVILFYFKRIIMAVE